LESNSTLILASGSRRRQELLGQLGIPFKAVPSHVEEHPSAGESPQRHVLRLCGEKARKVAEDYANHWVLGADTIVLLDDLALGKPRNRKEALWMLNALQGRMHEVLTGMCLLGAAAGRKAQRVVRTIVHMRNLAPDELNWYLRTGEPFDKAGGYAIQGHGTVLIKRIEGSYTNVVGLPLTELYEMLRSTGAWNQLAIRR
jgi:septum formation protein